MTRISTRAETGARAKAIICEPSNWTLLNFRLNLLTALKAQGYDVVAAAPDDEYTPCFAALGIRHVALPLDHAGMNPLVDLRALVALWRLFRHERPDLLHQSTQKLVLYGSLAARLAGVPAIVNTVNGLGAMLGDSGGVLRLIRPLLHAMMRVALRPPVRVCFQNEALEAFYLARRLVRPDQTTIIPGSGADPVRFAPRARSGGDDGPLRFLMFGRMIRSKGVEEYFRAAEAVSTGGGLPRPVAFALVGGARASDAARVHSEWIANRRTVPGEWLEREAAKGFVRWSPHREDIVESIHEADVVVLPSYYSEGVPRSLIEAMACGKAIITTDQPGCRDVVEVGRNGLLVPPRDVGALAEAMRQIAREPGTERRMGAESRRIFLDRYADCHVVARTLEVYARAGAPITQQVEKAA